MPDISGENGRGQSERLVALVVRRASTGLKVAAGVLAVAVLVQGWLAYTIDMNEIYNPGFDNPQMPFKVKLQAFLQSTVSSLIWIALLVAAAYGLQVAAALLARRAEPVSDEVVDDPADLFTASPSAVLSAPSTIPTPAPRWMRQAPPEVPVSDDRSGSRKTAQRGRRCQQATAVALATFRRVDAGVHRDGHPVGGGCHGRVGEADPLAADEQRHLLGGRHLVERQGVHGGRERAHLPPVGHQRTHGLQQVAAAGVGKVEGVPHATPASPDGRAGRRWWGR